jgi:hypothetical protein
MASELVQTLNQMMETNMKAVLKSGVRAGAFLLAFAALCGSASAGAGPPPDCPAVPEIDPGSVVGAMTLLVGGLMTLADKRRVVK